MSTVFAPDNNPSQSKMDSDLKADIVACVKSEMAKLKGQISTQLQHQARSASYAQAAATNRGPGTHPNMTAGPPARDPPVNKPAIVVTPKCNIDRSKKSLHEFIIFFMAGDYQIALLAEPYVGSGNEVRPIQGLNIYQFSQKGRVKACILTKPGCGQVLGMSQYSNTNFCVIQFKSGGQKMLIASAYIEPDSDGNNTLEHIDNFLQTSRCPNTIIGGDFNGWHHIWGSKTNNPRGCAVVELAYANDLFICNVGSTPTFETVTHGRDRTSIIDLTLAHGYIYDRIVYRSRSLRMGPVVAKNL
ncbi:unnamed protein product [Parnassius mnemosyne]|uniref:Endonuclease/exonuclease/phosphatase domain-containing protein n=1 Tax=Parnassius mnemosyne TaxID=213953 RepID=A0AAV1LAH0_9NEOP